MIVNSAGAPHATQIFARRDALTEDPNCPVAILNRAQRDLDLALDLSSEQSGDEAGHKQDERANKMKRGRAPDPWLSLGPQCADHNMRKNKILHGCDQANEEA